jgi:hypothetical protein
MTHQLHVGDQIEVHTNFEDSWVAGFEVADLLAKGYRVRRNSDGALLPGYTSEPDVRPTDREDQPGFGDSP